MIEWESIVHVVSADGRFRITDAPNGISGVNLREYDEPVGWYASIEQAQQAAELLAGHEATP